MGTGGTGGAPSRLQVAAAWIGVVAPGEGLTVAHHEGVVEAAKELGYVDYRYQDGLLGESASEYIDAAVAEGAGVIVGNSVDYSELMISKAEQYPHVAFLVSGGKTVGPNLGSYYAHIDQAWFIAGRMAARKTQTNHLGIIGSFITPEVVRNINAFTLGARHEGSQQGKEVFVEVRWLGFWFDPEFPNPQFEYTPLHLGPNASKQMMSGEEYLTAKLIDSGADVIAHQLENQFPVRYVARAVEEGNLSEVFAIAANNRRGWQDENGKAFANTIGSVYWNWGPVYKELFAKIHDGTWSPGDVLKPMTREDDSPVGFSMSDAETELSTILRDYYLNEAVEAGSEGLWTGPIETTGQRPVGDVPPGEVIDEAEWNSMCWFAKGVVERENPNDPLSALVSARVPDDVYVGKQGDRFEPPEGEVRQPAAAPEVLVSLGIGNLLWNCRHNHAGGG